jgi:prefoldin beta subunit
MENSQQALMQLQQKQQKLQEVAQQREEAETELQESRQALDALEDREDSTVFKQVGSVMIERDVANLKEELEDRTQLLEARTDKFEKRPRTRCREAEGT